MVNQDFTEADIEKFEKAFEVWEENKDDVKHWMTHYGEPHAKAWAMKYGTVINGNGPEFVTYMIDGFVEWIKTNVVK